MVDISNYTFSLNQFSIKWEFYPSFQLNIPAYEGLKGNQNVKKEKINYIFQNVKMSIGENQIRVSELLR